MANPSKSVANQRTDPQQLIFCCNNCVYQDWNKQKSANKVQGSAGSILVLGKVIWIKFRKCFIFHFHFFAFYYWNCKYFQAYSISKLALISYRIFIFLTLLGAVFWYPILAFVSLFCILLFIMLSSESSIIDIIGPMVLSILFNK